MNSTVDIFSTLDDKEAILDNIKLTLGYEELKKDPQGSCFYYLVPEGKDVSPIAIAFLPELDNNNQNELSAELFDTKSELYKRIYGHYINRQFSEQPALYMLLPEKNINGFAIITKPTDSGLRARSTSFYKLNERDFHLKLECLEKSSLRILEGLFAKIPQIDFLFYNTIHTASDLAKELAKITRELEQSIITIYNKEKIDGFLHQLHESFRKELLPLIQLESKTPKEYGFADLYAQTISYGMFSARFFKPDKNFERIAIADYIPPTNPFLKNLFTSITTEQESKDELYKELFDKIEDLVGTLSSVNMDSVLKDFHFDDENQEDIVIHFYETFLSEYNQEQREIRGVYYTPTPIVSYIVRSVDKILKTSFNKSLGISDPSVLILDPATGTGTFLFSIINEIHKYYEMNLRPQNEKSWNDFVDENILPRLFGFELMMAPYAIAHLKLGLELQKYGYNFDSKKRLGVYLTNTLEDTVKKSETLFEEFISKESDEASVIKNEKPIMVIVGNPPYSGNSANNNIEWIKNLIDDYKYCDDKPLKERNTKWLQNDYIKFIRFAQWRINLTGEGVVAFITDNSYLDGPTFKGMRQHLLRTFNDIYIYNLHGNLRRKEKTLDGLNDENVFDIQQGVSICFLIKKADCNKHGEIYISDLYGSDRELHKYPVLSNTDISTTDWTKITPSAPLYIYNKENKELKREYEQYTSLLDIFIDHTPGFVTGRDPIFIASEKEALEKMVEIYCNFDIDDDDCKEKLNLTDKAVNNRKMFRNDNMLLKNDIKECLYRPFDKKYVLYNNHILERARYEEFRHMLDKDNIALITSRLTKGEDFAHCLVSDCISETILLSSKTSNNAFSFPLYRDESNNLGLIMGNADAFGRCSNINRHIFQQFSENLNYLPKNEEIFYYIYSLLHCSNYRERYVDFLRSDFPRIPITSSKELFKHLVSSGENLVNLHLMKINEPNSDLLCGDGSNIVSITPFYDKTTERIYINDTQYFKNIAPEIWDFYIGGYNVLDKWLKDKKKAHVVLTMMNIYHFEKIVIIIDKTIKVIEQIDETIEEYGGWPLA